MFVVDFLNTSFLTCHLSVINNLKFFSITVKSNLSIFIVETNFHSFPFYKRALYDIPTQNSLPTSWLLVSLSDIKSGKLVRRNSLQNIS